MIDSHRLGVFAGAHSKWRNSEAEKHSTAVARASRRARDKRRWGQPGEFDEPNVSNVTAARRQHGGLAAIAQVGDFSHSR